MDLTEELRSRASVFVDTHIGIRVTVIEGNIVEFAGAQAAEVLRAAADWMHDDPSCLVTAVGWEEQTPHEHPLRLVLALDRPPRTAER